MCNDLQEKVAIVTGGGRDIGRHICLELANRGAKVVVNYHSSKMEANDTVNMIRENGGQAIAVQADVTNPDSIESLVQRSVAEFGKSIHILVNNAGGLVARKTMEEMDSDFWDTVMTLNLKSTFLVTKQVLSHIPEGGAIVNLSSLAARNGGGGGAIAYSTSKGGVLTFTRGLAKELSNRKIRVNCVSPGLINTTFHDTFTPDDARSNTADSTAVGREGTPAEVGKTVAFLASDESSYIDGESIEINGGLYFN
ncbi:MAG: 3-oxoacyl-ACP reductase FabG [Candidatus Marinimicrobia bacterium]|nr:3-oxoacyl-ACP reductase FabG [Candidatus Neomarinimicrobiota bacterium]MCF7828925.1 3-oxoacyl-ACP reductase FabG [Candidatus Neomarinimicrobiota bacterium]MCF7879885.1 3-oxoacyl-ACP reductase FabG [Candidatus Neomarinimicrobiota bacterium]